MSEIILEEQSMLFSMPGWRTWDVKEIARLRAEEIILYCDSIKYRKFFRRKWLDGAWSPRKVKMIRRWLGEAEGEIDEGVLESELRAGWRFNRTLGWGRDLMF